MPWNTYIDFLNMIDVSIMTAASALARQESRAAHYRSDHPQQDDVNGLYNIFLARGDNGMPVLKKEPVRFAYKSLQECQDYRK
jgi:succinate dehydrogenase/fumarate reductase flavoprotein subunit